MKSARSRDRGTHLARGNSKIDLAVRFHLATPSAGPWQPETLCGLAIPARSDVCCDPLEATDPRLRDLI